VSTHLQQLKTYHLQERVGSSSIAEVWKAFDLQSQRPVALKIFRRDLQNDPYFMTRFWNLPFSQQAQKLLALQHPHLVKIHSFQISRPSEAEHPLAYVVMDYVEGPTLAEYLRETSYKQVFPSATEIVHLFAAIGAAIDYAHQQGVIHGDLKPTKILLDQRNTSHNAMGEPLLADLGMTQLLEPPTGALSHRETETAYYISPEQVLGQPPNERSDLYALGVILYELCTGQLPFRGKDEQDLMMQHLNTALPSPAQINPALSPALSAVIERSLEKDSAKRFSSAATMITALAEALQVPLIEHPSQPAYPTNTLNGQTDLSSAPPTLPDQALSEPLSHHNITDQSSPVIATAESSREADRSTPSSSNKSSVASQTPNPAQAPSEQPPAPLAPFPSSQ
jgi:serine/threonine protein kinase